MTKSLKDQRYIIGITGPFGSGKSTAAEFFKSKGYAIVKLSELLEKDLEKQKKPVTRKNLQDLGNLWREKYGAGVIVKKALISVKDKKRVVIDGLRNIGEVEEIRKNKKNVVLAIIADRNIRLERLKKLKRREKLNKKLFDKLDSRDLGIGEKDTGLQVAYCVALADRFIDSNSSIIEFEKKLNEFLKEYERN